MDKEKNVVEEAIKEAKEAAQESAGQEEETVEQVKTEEENEEQEVEEVEESGDVKKEKKQKCEKKIKKDKKEEQIEELKDKLTRQMAEFDNFRKRTTKEKSAMYEVGAKEVLEKILPVVDNFERGLAAVPEEDKGQPFVEGMDKIYKQLLTVLEELGVTAIEAVGEAFNPDYHNAVMHVEDDNYEENTVAEEFQKGYLYKEAVLRHSMVKVAN